MTTPLERAFEDDRRYVWGVSYRMTGSAADADDIVQETFARALEHQPAADRPLRPWLTRVAVNLARDQLRRRQRRGYPGPWLPTPVSDDELARVDLTDDGALAADARYDLKESATLAFLLAMEALKPQQRAVLLLRDVLAWSVRETALALSLSEPNVKTTLHRARAAMRAYDERRAPLDDDARARAEAALQRFLEAVMAGDEARLLELLSDDVEVRSDSGGVYSAAYNVVTGPRHVAALLLGVLRKNAPDAAELVRVNGAPAVLSRYTPRRERDAPRVLLTVDVDPSGRLRGIYTVGAPDKLTRV